MVMNLCRNANIHVCFVVGASVKQEYYFNIIIDQTFCNYLYCEHPILLSLFSVHLNLFPEIVPRIASEASNRK